MAVERISFNETSVAARKTVLVAVASRHGSTAEIATRIGARLSETLPSPEWFIDVADTDSIDSLDNYDAVVLGSAIYVGHWLKSARKLLEKVDVAPRLGMWLFGSGPANDGAQDSESVEVAVSAVSRLGIRDNIIFAGRINLDSLGRIEQMLTSAMKVAGGDFRDWDAIDAWADGIAHDLLIGSA